MSVLITFANVNLFGSCAVAVFDVGTRHFAWLPTVEFIDIGGVDRAVQAGEDILLLYRNSAGGRRIACLDAALAVRFVSFEGLLDQAVDLFIRSGDVILLTSEGEYRLSIQGQRCAFEPAGTVQAGAIRGAAHGDASAYVISERETREDRTFTQHARFFPADPATVEQSAVSELVNLGGDLYIGDANPSSLTRLGGHPASVSFTRGYVRGVCDMGDELLVGLGPWRYPLRRFGRRATPSWVQRSEFAQTYSSQICRLNPDLTLIEEIDISHIGGEVSSILPLDAAIAVDGPSTQRGASRRALMLAERSLVAARESLEAEPIIESAEAIA